MKNVNISSEDIKSIYEVSYNISKSRGKNRQETINNVIINLLKDKPEYADCDFKSEVRIPGTKLLWGKYFKIFNIPWIYRSNIFLNQINPFITTDRLDF